MPSLPQKRGVESTGDEHVPTLTMPPAETESFKTDMHALKQRVPIAPSHPPLSTALDLRPAAWPKSAADGYCSRRSSTIMEDPSLILLRHMFFVADTYQSPYSILKPNIFILDVPPHSSYQASIPMT